MVDTAISADGLRIVYEVHGTGEPALVFIHGWSCDRTYWHGQLEDFSHQFRVVAVDLAGHGESGSGRQLWSIAAFGEDVAAVVRGLGLERIILIGHSMGGDVILEAARRLPGQVTGLVWVDTYNQLATHRSPKQIEAFVAPFRVDFRARTQEFVRSTFPTTASESLVEWVAADMSAAPPETALPALESAVTFKREVAPALKELNLPAVAINPEDIAADISSMNRHGVDVVIMRGVGHFLMMEDPETFNGLLRGVIDKFPRAAARHDPQRGEAAASAA